MSNTMRMLTTAEAAARAGVSARTIARYADDGDLIATVTEGGHRRIYEGDLEAFLARRAHAAPGAVIVACANQKGGVGKTTLTANLGVLLQQMGMRVLLVDLDPQGHLTFTLGVNPDSLARTIYDVMLSPRSVAIGDVIVKTQFGPDLAPINISASDVDVEFSNRPMWGAFLQKALTPVRNMYDYILIDSAPNLGKLTVCAFMAADYVLIPTQPQILSVRGLHLLLTRIDEARADVNSRLQIAGAVPMMAQSSNADQMMDQALRQALGSRAIHVFSTSIPYSTAYKEAANAHGVMSATNPTSKYTDYYRQLLGEIVTVIGGPATAVIEPTAEVLHAS